MTKYLIAALGLCLGCGVAVAGDASFESLDENADGLITTNEALADPGLVEVFATFDVNGDGFLSVTEFSAIESSKQAEEG